MSCWFDTLDHVTSGLLGKWFQVNFFSPRCTSKGATRPLLKPQWFSPVHPRIIKFHAISPPDMGLNRWYGLLQYQWFVGFPPSCSHCICPHFRHIWSERPNDAMYLHCFSRLPNLNLDFKNNRYGDNIGSNWGCYPPCEVEKNGRLSAYSLGYDLLLEYKSTNLYSKTKNWPIIA